MLSLRNLHWYYTDMSNVCLRDFSPVVAIVTEILKFQFYYKLYYGKGILENACTDTRTRTGGHGHGHLWKRRTVMEKTDSYGKDGQLWKRRTVMEKTDTYGKDGHLWKRRTLMEKTDTYGKDRHLWKRRTQSI